MTATTTAKRSMSDVLLSAVEVAAQHVVDMRGTSRETLARTDLERIVRIYQDALREEGKR